MLNVTIVINLAIMLGNIMMQRCMSMNKSILLTTKNMKSPLYCLLLKITLKNNERNEESSWYLDNGESNHMCGDKLKFASINEKVQGNISFGDSLKIQICGKGTILISSRNGSHRLIHDVY